MGTPEDDAHLPAPEDRYAERGSSALRIGQGAYGEVTLVFDRLLGREVARKELRGETRSDVLPDRSATEAALGETQQGPDEATLRARQRFIAEARLTARLEHPSIVPIHDLGIDEQGRPYYTMKPIRGQTLAEAIAQAADLDERLRLLDPFIDLCLAVAWAHSRGVVHRDLKPGNVMIGAFGETVLLDWGLAWDRGQGAPPEQGPIGSPPWMSPEAAHGLVCDERSDVFSLGAILYHILTGHPPFASESPASSLNAARQRRWPLLGPGKPEIPPPLRSLVNEAMRPWPEQRPADPLELVDGLRAFREGGLVRLHRYSRLERLNRHLARHGRRWLSLAVGLALLLGITLVQAALTARQRDRAVAAEEALADQLARSHEARAVEALADGDGFEATRSAVRSLVLRESAAARGALVGGTSGLLGRRTWAVVGLDGLRSVLWHPTAGLFALTRDRILRLDEDGRVQGTIRGLPGRMIAGAVAISPSGRRLALGGDGGVYLFEPEVDSDRPRAFIGTAAASPLALEWLDEARLVISDAEDEVGVWQVDPPLRLGAFRGQAGAIRALEVLPGGDRVASASNARSIKSWSVTELREAPALQDEGVGAFDLEASRDGSLLAAVGEVHGGDGRIRLWSLQDGHLLRAVDAHRAEAVRVAFRPTRGQVLSAARDGTVKLWSLPALRLVASLRNEAGVLASPAWSPSGDRLALARVEGRLEVWEVERTDADLPRLDPDRPPLALAWSPGGRLAAADESGKVWLRDPAGGGAWRSVQLDGYSLHSVAWRGEEEVIAFGPHQGAIVLDAVNLRPLRELDPVARELSFSARIAPDGRWLVGARLDGAAFALPTDGGPARPVRCGRILGAASFAPDGARALATGIDGDLFEVRPDGACRRLAAPELRSANALLSPDGQTLAWVNGAGLGLYRSADLERIHLLDTEPYTTGGLAFAAEGRWLIHADWQGRIQVYDTRDGRRLAVWRAHANRIWDLALAPDGRRVSTVSADRTLRTWDLDPLDLAAAALPGWLEAREGRQLPSEGDQ